MNTIMVAVDGSEHAQEALALTSLIAKQTGASVLLIHVVTSREPSKEVRHAIEVEFADEFAARTNASLKDLSMPMGAHYAEMMLTNQASIAQVANSIFGDHILKTAKSFLVHEGLESVETLLVEGDPAETILEKIKEHSVDTMVMGCRGAGRIKGLVGSVSREVAHHAECRVIMVKY